MPYRVPSGPRRAPSPDVDERLFARGPFHGLRWVWFAFWAPWLVAMSFGDFKVGGVPRPMPAALQAGMLAVVAIVSVVLIVESVRRRRRTRKMVERLLRVDDDPTGVRGAADGDVSASEDREESASRMRR